MHMRRLGGARARDPIIEKRYVFISYCHRLPPPHYFGSRAPPPIVWFASQLSDITPSAPKDCSVGRNRIYSLLFVMQMRVYLYKYTVLVPYRPNACMPTIKRF